MNKIILFKYLMLNCSSKGQSFLCNYTQCALPKLHRSPSPNLSKLAPPLYFREPICGFT